MVCMQMPVQFVGRQKQLLRLDYKLACRVRFISMIDVFSLHAITIGTLA